MQRSEACTVYRILREYYGVTRSSERHFLDFKNPFEILVMTILSAQTTDRTVNAVKDTLFHRYPDPAALARADPAEVERIIRSTGFFRAKARNIIRAAGILESRHGGNVPSSMDELLLLPGVGRKTANIVLHHAYDITAGIAVDTHVKRVSTRLGFTEKTDPDEIEKDLTVLFPRKAWSEINYLFIRHGRSICDAKKPRCTECPVSGHCRYYLSGRSGDEGRIHEITAP
ncbi:MAG: endonuclease III [Methanoculleus sp. SDB]|nr:MAG: endonuclease III [Methanoculleus sp. SDB]